MKTISVQRLMPAPFGNTQGLVEAATIVVGEQRSPIRGSIASWLPEPPSRRHDCLPHPRAIGSISSWLPAPPPRLSPAVNRADCTSAKAACSPWLPLESERMVEKLMWCLLVLAAVMGITHGFSFLVDWVQNWAGFNAAAAQLIQ